MNETKTALFLLGLLAISTIGCKKEEEEPALATTTSPVSTISYTNVSPDVTVDYTSAALYVDMDGDGDDDVWLRAQLIVDYTGPVPVDNFYLKSIALDSAVDVSLGSWSGMYDLFASGDAVGDAVYWTNDALIQADLDGTMTGPWIDATPNVTDGWIGVRIGAAGSYRYGWINVYCTSHTITLKSHAFETTLNTAINAGTTGQ